MLVGARPVLPARRGSGAGSIVLGVVITEGMLALLATPSLLEQGPGWMLLWHLMDAILIPLTPGEMTTATRWTTFILSSAMVGVNGALIDSDASKSDVYWINFAGWNAVVGGMAVSEALSAHPETIAPPDVIATENFSMLRPSPDRWKEDGFIESQEHGPTFTNRFRKSKQSTTLKFREEGSDSALADIDDLMRREQLKLAGDTTLTRPPEIRLGHCGSRDCVCLRYRKRTGPNSEIDVNGSVFLLEPGNTRSLRVEWVSFMKAGTGRAELSLEDIAILESVRNRR